MSDYRMELLEERVKTSKLELEMSEGSFELFIMRARARWLQQVKELKGKLLAAERALADYKASTKENAVEESIGGDTVDGNEKEET